MARPYQKKGSSFGGRGGGRGGDSNGGRGGGGGGGGPMRRGNDFGSNNNHNNGGGRGRQGRDRGRGGNRGGGSRNNDSRDKNNRDGGAGADLMTTLLRLLFEKSHAQIFTEENGLLNLTGTRYSPDLASVQKNVNYNTVAFCKSLAEVLRGTFGDRIRVIQLDDNEISNLDAFLQAMVDVDLHNNITAISIIGNKLDSTKFVHVAKKFKNLKELILTGNPLCNAKDYPSQVTRALTGLNMLDGQVIEHNLVTLPNPIRSGAPTDAQMNVLTYVERTVMQSMSTGNFDVVPSVYSGQRCGLTVSRQGDVYPSKLPISAIYNTTDLDTKTRQSINTDIVALRQGVDWRNLETDLGSTLRNVVFGPKQITSKLNSIRGGAKPFNLRMELNSNFNVMFMEESYHMKVPVCVLTIHGKMHYSWNPRNAATGQTTFQDQKAPRLVNFFDRTMALTWDHGTNAWTITNDMLNVRRDYNICHDDGSETSPLFFAETPQRVEALRRKLMPGITIEVMQALVEGAINDETIRGRVQALQNLPPDQLREVSGNPDMARRLLGI